MSVVGPSGVSSVALVMESAQFNVDQFLKTNHLQAGEFNASGDTLSFSGIYAINDRISVGAAIPWNYSGDSTSLCFGETTDASYKVASRNVNAAEILIDNKTGPGFMLVVGSGMNWLAADNKNYYGFVQPQYRFNPTVLVTSYLDYRHQEQGVASQNAVLNVVWDVAPQWVVVPSLSYEHLNQDDETSSQNARAAALSATYHINRQWSISAVAGLSRDSAVTYLNYANEDQNGKGHYVNATIRSYFN